MWPEGVSVSIFPCYSMSVIEISDEVKRKNGYQTGERRNALRADIRPKLILWLDLAWLGIAPVNQPRNTTYIRL